MNTVDWSPDGLQLASGDDEGVIQVLGDAELVLTRTLTSVLSTFTLFYVLFELFMMKSLLFFLQIWDLASGQVTQTLEGHDGTVWSVTFSPDGSQLASASSDDTVKVIWKRFSLFLACLERSRSILTHFYRSGTSLPAKSRKL